MLLETPSISEAVITTAAPRIVLIKPRSRRNAPNKLRRWTTRILLLIAVAFLVNTFIGEAALVPTGSMQGTILIGDHILLNKLSYGPAIPFTGWRLPQFKSVQRGNIIAFHYPRDPSMNFLKRVAAVGGDVVEIRDDILYINGIPIREPYAVHTAKRWLRHPEQMSPRLVPAGNLFVLGDNRDNSDDSRYWGMVPVANVIGEPFMIVWSYDAPSRDWLDENPARQLRFYASIMTNLVGRTRWSRTGSLL
ncbi:MAG: signal peptidase [Acidobacteriales bacterium]|nr:signal peptidase [Terriglobales bacterium]